jgi:cyclophilin family peptidyl-prolyl cis-trans isomerase/HEAT repeat protein
LQKILMFFSLSVFLFNLWGCSPKVEDGSFRRIAILEDRRIINGDELKGFLLHHNEHIRILAIMASGRIGDKAFLNQLYPLLYDPSPGIRLATIFAIGQLSDSASAKRLCEYFQHAPIEEKKCIIDALGRLNCEESRLFLRNLLQAGDKHLLSEVFLALTRLKDQTSLRPISFYFQDSIEVLRQNALYSAYRMADSTIAQDLLPSLKHPDAVTRKYAVGGLGRIGDSQYAYAILPLLEDEVRAVRIQTVRALGRMKAEVAHDQLLKLAEGEDFHFYKTALQALGNIKSLKSAGRLEELLKRTYGLKLTYLLPALTRIEGERFIPFLETFSDHPEANVRKAVASSLAFCRGTEALKVVNDLLADSDATVRAEAVMSLAEYGTSAIPIIEGTLKDDDWGVRVCSAEALVKMESRASFGIIRQTFEARCDSNREEECRAELDALFALDGEKCRPLLKEALSSRHPSISYLARKYLEELGEKLPPITISENDYPPDFGALLGRQTISLLTNKGRIEIALFGDITPTVSAKFLEYAKYHFYDGLIFHRVEPDFVVQGGDPRGDGLGGPGYYIRDQINRKEFIRGSVGLANAGKDTGGSQFFICLSPQPHLNGNYTNFGEVVKGWDVLDRLVEGDRIMDITVTTSLKQKIRQI